jgi:hypothetical protein
MPFVRILVGAVLGWVVIVASVALLGILAVWSPFPKTWWMHHMTVVMIGSELLAAVPLVVALGFLMSRLYRVRPVASALASMTLALLASSAGAFTDPEALSSSWRFFVPFLLVPPLVVHFLVHHLRSNNRWSGP